MSSERRPSFSKTWSERLAPIRDYFRETDLHGYKFLAESNRILLERVIWSAVLMAFMFGSMYTISSNLGAFLEAPTAISEVPTKRSVNEIPFPGVSVCMANRFSKRRAMAFAELIFKKQNDTGFNVGDKLETVFEELKGLVHLIDFSSPKDDTGLFKLHSVLRSIYNGSYPIRDIINDLQVPCADILIFCAWLDKEVNCSETFQSRRTYAGQCCIFNYIRPKIEEFREAIQNGVEVNVSDPLQTSSNVSTKFRGLSVVIDFTPEDDVVTLTNTFDTIIQIINPRDYPDVTNGAIREAFVGMGTQTYVQIFPKYVRANPELRGVRSSIRNCVFDDEVKYIHKNYYTYGECILTCRLSDIIRMCGCTPPSMTVIHNATYCDLADLLCLIRFNERWINSDINTYDFSILNPNCVSCYPTCDYLRYEVQTTYTEMRDLSYVDVFGRYREPVPVDPSRQSIVHVYYGDNVVKEFEQSMISTWYDLLSSLGGIVALMTGGSLITLVEVSYLLTGRFGANYIRDWIRRYRRNKEKQRRKRREEDVDAVSRDNEVPPFMRLQLPSNAY